ncbi:MAG TPA: TetR/AcrR family transcriptional regulator, partial [Aestuariivirgaceae bacterium]|nr:TetR/AcrR family transcriptional regulator [Aestuariivirgaceae bacterium]
MTEAETATPRELLKARKQAQVREEIVRVAAKLFAERGYRAVTIDDIANELGFTKSAVYYYFGNKAQILWHIYEEIYDSYISMVSEIRDANLSPRDAMQRIIYQHVLWVIERRDWTAIYFREESELNEDQRGIIRRRKRDYDAIIEGIYAAGVKQKVFADIPPHIAVSGILGMCNWLYLWFNDKGPVTPDEIAMHYVTLLAQGYERAT